jgi:hypothetical protein
MRFSAIAAAAGRVLVQCGLFVAVVGCSSTPAAAPPPVDLFAPRDMRIHPIFTQLADLTGGGKPDGVEAQLEFDDQFGDPTKASGQVLFELFEYRKQPPYTGKRVAGPWVASLATPVEQRDKWNKTLRTYRFPLAYPGINPAQDYVLTATFELTGGGRFFDKRVLTARHSDKSPGDATGGAFGL